MATALSSNALPSELIPRYSKQGYDLDSVKLRREWY